MPSPLKKIKKCRIKKVSKLPFLPFLGLFQLLTLPVGCQQQVGEGRWFEALQRTLDWNIRGRTSSLIRLPLHQICIEIPMWTETYSSNHQNCFSNFYAPTFITPFYMMSFMSWRGGLEDMWINDGPHADTFICCENDKYAQTSRTLAAAILCFWPRSSGVVLCPTAGFSCQSSCFIFLYLQIHN